MNREINLLSSLPKTKRDIKLRAEDKTESVIKEAKKFGHSYFDGTREQGYGGYKYDSRWKSVAQDIIKFFGLSVGDRVLDIGCAKGFLVYDLMQEGRMLDVCGVDVSRYALDNAMSQVAHRLYLSDARNLPFANKFFDLVISINTLHNLPREGVIKALKEIERVCRGNSYIVVDAYTSLEEKALFESWCLTAETHMYSHEWLKLFEEAGYTGFYSWNIL